MKPYEEIKDSLTTLCEMKVSYRPKIAKHPVITDSNGVEKLKWLMFPEDTINWRESFWAIFMNAANKVLAIVKIADGSQNQCLVPKKALFQYALLCNARSIILCHNHPSGTVRPSTEDDNLTKAIADGARLLEMRVFDHIIFTESEYYSYSDHSRI